MSDPAMEAARRAWLMDGRNTPSPSLRFDLSVDTAREALAPIRELDVPGLLERLAEILSHLVMDTEREQELTDRYIEMLRNAAANTARLIYTSEEL